MPNDIRDILSQGWIGTTVGVIGVLIGAILAYAFKPRSRLAAQTNTLELVGPNSVLPNEIEFLFRGDKVSNVTLSRVAIWNTGNTTVRGAQIVESDPLRIAVSNGAHILETTVLRRTREVNDVSCVLRQDTGSAAEFRFDYLDPGDGALVQLIHTGNAEIRVIGSIRGIRAGVRVLTTTRKPKEQELQQLSPSAGKLLSLSVIIVGLVMVIRAVLRTNIEGLELFLFTAMVGAGILLYFGVSRLAPSELSTQITSNEPTRKPFWAWQSWTRR